jgi:hypothetical protein
VVAGVEDGQRSQLPTVGRVELEFPIIFLLGEESRGLEVHMDNHQLIISPRIFVTSGPGHL